MKKALFVVLACLAFGVKLFADDPGITKTRLLEVNDSTYILEADISANLAWAIKPPIFPDRFSVSPIEYIEKRGWVLVRIVISTSDEKLNIEDKILLPWLRNGVDLTVRWQDGSLSKGMFIREIDGIHIPMSELIEARATSWQVVKDSSLLGLQSSVHLIVNLILLFALLARFRGSKVWVLLLSLFMGHGIALVLFDLGVPGMDLLFVSILALVFSFLLSAANNVHTYFRHYQLLVFGYGVIHGLAISKELGYISGLGNEQNLMAQFATSFTIDAVLVLTTALLVAWIGSTKNKIWIRYIPGVLSVTLFLGLASYTIHSQDRILLKYDRKNIPGNYTLPQIQPFNTGQTSQGARSLTSPIMNYVSIEQNELRQEILFNARTAVQLLGINDKGMFGIPVESLSPIKEGLLSVINDQNMIWVDQVKVTPLIARADFVTLGPAGVIIREIPQNESLDQGIIGLTLIYELPNLPDNVDIEWNSFANDNTQVETTISDPYGSSVMVLTQEDNLISWEKEYEGFPTDAIKEKAFAYPRLPYLSIVLFMAAIMAYGLLKNQLRHPLVGVFLIAAFISYPFVRTEATLKIFESWNPSEETTSDVVEHLLTNIYKAFEVRNEEDVYDRLALSVEGDQLVEIYLQNRQKMELEYLGGARARVEEVEIVSISNIERADNGQFLANVVWNVGGSVSHFGHTHYRRNLNNAIITFGINDDLWKIKEIEILNEQRIL